MAKLLVEVQCGKKKCGFCHAKEVIGTRTKPLKEVTDYGYTYSAWCSLFSRNLALDGIPAKPERCQDCLDAEVEE